MTGIFDLPAPLFTWADQLMSGIAPPTFRLIIWGLMASALSMGCYWLFSPQEKLTDVKIRALAARRDLNAFDGEFSHAWPLMCSMLSLSFRQLLMTTLPALLASLPVLALIVWLGTAYGYGLPAPDNNIDVETMPDVEVFAEVQILENASPGNPPRLIIKNADGGVISNISLAAPVPTIHKRRWWNRLFGNPLGYLPTEGPFEAITFDLPEKDYLGFGPVWLRPWYVLFFMVLVLGSLAIKRFARIE